MFYKPVGPSGYVVNNIERMKDVTDGEQFETVLQDLDKYVIYNVRILAYTKIGNGPNSTAIERQTMEDSMLLIS